jgi:hypothetical protein
MARAGTEVAAAINGPDKDTPRTPTTSMERCIPLSRPDVAAGWSVCIAPSSPVPSLCGTLHLVADTAQTANEVSQRAILDEALKKGALVWLQVDGRDHARWHAWTGEHVYLLTGSGEQPDPGLVPGGAVGVVVRSKDNRHRLIAFVSDVSALTADDEDWEAATAELAKQRLNLSDAEHAPARWAGPEFTLYRLTPRLPLVEDVDDVPTVSHRAAPVPTEATTAGRKPYVLHRRHGSGRPLS